MKRYVVGFVFECTMDKVLLLQRNKHPYKDLFNGVGGKIEEGETPEQAMIRELAEETGIHLKPDDRIGLLCTSMFPSNVELHAFYVVLNKQPDMMRAETDEGTLYWLEVGNDLLYAANPILAGEGNVAYFLNYARLLNAS